MNVLSDIFYSGNGKIVGKNKTKVRVISKIKDGFIYQVYNKSGLLYQGSDEQEVVHIYSEHEVEQR